MDVSWHDYASNATRRMAQSELDALLSPSRLVASLDDELARYAAVSEQARAAAARSGGLREGLSYGTGEDEKLDLLMAPSTGPQPLLIYLHGGFWQQLSRRESVFAAPGILAHGSAYAAIGYTLAPHATLDEIVAQVRRAVEWLYREADALGLDRTRFVVAGSSAGAHLAAMVLLTDWSARGLPGDCIAGACLVSGVYDLAAVRASYVNAPLNLSEGQVARLSPLRHSPPTSVPTVLVFGDNETDEFKRESRHYAAHLTSAGQPVHALEVAGRQHFDVIGDLDNRATYLGHATAALLGSRA